MITILALDGGDSSTTMWNQVTWRTFRVSDLRASLTTAGMITIAFWRRFLFSDTAHGMERDGICIGVILLACFGLSDYLLAFIFMLDTFVILIDVAW